MYKPLGRPVVSTLKKLVVATAAPGGYCLVSVPITLLAGPSIWSFMETSMLVRLPPAPIAARSWE